MSAAASPAAADEAMDTDLPAAPEATLNKKARQALLTDFEIWQVKTSKGDLDLLEVQQDSDDGKTSLRFRLTSSGLSFTLHCPLQYPRYSIDEDNFFVEADYGLHAWCNALNEYLLDSVGVLSLADILNKGLSLYSSADQAAAAAAAAAGGSAGSGSSSANPNSAAASDYGEDDDEDDKSSGHEMDMDAEIDDEDDEDPAQGEDEQLEDILDNDLTWELEIARRKKRWRIKEDELRNEKLKHVDSSTSGGEEDRTLQQLYHDPSIKSRQPKQVFTSAAASGILTNDLVQIMEKAQETGIEADTIDDNIFQWNVKIRNFTSNCVLDQDFQELKSRFGYDYIELQLDFSMDLYPFFPPLVKVIRPRLQGSMMLRVTTMEILKLSYWNPARDMKSVLAEIKSFLRTWARLDLQSDRNHRTRYPDGAYIDIEHHLLRLALVSEIVPRANKKYVSTTPPPKASLPPTAMEPTLTTEKRRTEPVASASVVVADKKQKSKFAIFGGGGTKDKEEKKKSIAKNMAKGTGYSSYQQKGWDVKAYMAAQKEKDKQIELVLGKIHQELKKLHGSGQQAGRSLPDVVDHNSDRAGGRGGSRRKRKHSPDEISPPLAQAEEDSEDGGAVGGAGARIDPQSDLYAVLEGSALVPFLESKLNANSFLEICSHNNVYKCVVNILREIASQPYLVSLLGPLPDQATSLHSLLLSLETQARILLDKIGKASANGSVPRSGVTSTSGAGAASAGATSKSEKMPDKVSDDKLARDFLTLSKDVTKALKSSGLMPDMNGEASSSNGSAFGGSTSADVHMASSSSPEATEREASPLPGPSGAKAGTNSEDQVYRSYMRSLQLDSVDFSLSGSQAHAFASSYNKAGTPSSQVIIRVAQEVSSLSTSLPLDFSSAIFIRSDDDKATLLRAIITGPEDTPYTGGCYQFDIHFPAKYPQYPPQVSFRTTGGGLVRFNPNLYHCGKVCLSLLGTWEGAQGEQWNETSTILQVLISIQSLILCSEPYYNEPGFERLYGTPQGNQESLKYSEDVFRNNLKYAILGQLQHPPEGFEAVIRAHFYLKRNALLKELEKMLEKYKSKDVKKQFVDVKRELMKLTPPSSLKQSPSSE